MKVLSALLSAIICISSLSVAKVNAVENVDDLKAQITMLQEENAQLREEIEASNELLSFFLSTIDDISTGDMNGDGYTDAVDASLILSYYAFISTGHNVSLRTYIGGMKNGNTCRDC